MGKWYGSIWAAAFVLLTAFRLDAQEARDSIFFQLEKTLPIQCRMATADNLGQFYIVTPENRLEKYSHDGVRLSFYTQNRLGNIALIDVSNPMKIMIFYRDFQKIIFLDRNLTFLSELELSKTGAAWVKTVANSRDGNLWLYDEAEMKLQKCTNEGAILFESPPLNQMTVLPPSADFILEQDNEVYLADTRQGVFIFDQYALLQKNVTAQDFTDFNSGHRRLFFVKKGALNVSFLDSFQTETYILPKETKEKGTGYKVLSDCFLLWDENGVKVYKYRGG